MDECGSVGRCLCVCDMFVFGGVNVRGLKSVGVLSAPMLIVGSEVRVLWMCACKCLRCVWCV